MIFQRIPKRMRRRVMSTTVKRMPNDLQAAHKKSVLIKSFYFSNGLFKYFIGIYDLDRKSSQ